MARFLICTILVVGVCARASADGVVTTLERDRRREVVAISVLDSLTSTEKKIEAPHKLVFRGTKLVSIFGPDDPDRASDIGASRYVNGVESDSAGTHVAYDSVGRKLAEYRVVNRRLDGPFTAYANDGDVAIEGAFRAGAREGTWREWDAGSRYGRTKRTLIFEANFVAGRLDGVATCRDLLGNTATVTYRAGRLDGTTTYSSADGTVVATYRNGRREGEARLTRSDGESVTTYRGGVAHGPAQVTISRDFVERGNYVDGYKEGTWQQFDAGGHLQRTEVYRRGILSGPTTVAVNGVEKRAEYVDGKLLSIHPAPESYAWAPLSTQLSSGAMFGRASSFVARFELARCGARPRHVMGSTPAGGRSPSVARSRSTFRSMQ